MKKLFLLFAALSALTGAAFAQEVAVGGVVTTGTVERVNKDGSLVVRSDQTNGPVTFYGVANTNIFTTDGSPATLADLLPATKVTVQYATRQGKWYVSKILYSAGPNAPTAIPANAPPPVTIVTPHNDTASEDGRTGGKGTVSPVRVTGP